MTVPQLHGVVSACHQLRGGSCQGLYILSGMMAPDPGHRGSYNTGHRTHASGHVRHKTSRVVSLNMDHVVTVWSS